MALWIKEHAHAFRVMGVIFFLATFGAGVMWASGKDIAAIVWLLGFLSSLAFTSRSIASYVIPDRKSVKEMNYGEILKFIVTTDPKKHWERLQNEYSTEIFLKEDPRLRFKVKYIDDGVHRENFVEEWANCHPDKKATSYWHHLYYEGDLIKSFILVSVDGERASLPLPNLGSREKSILCYRVAQIHDTLGTLDEYIKRSGLQLEDFQ